MMTLGLLSPGEKCEIVEVKHCGGCGGNCHSGDHKHDHNHSHGKHGKTETRAEEMGLRVGKRVEMLKNDGNLLLLLIDEARIAIDRRMAMKIMVRS
jgi:ferrous iron transport protein A